MKTLRISLFVPVLILLLSGCVAGWTKPGDGMVTDPGNSFSVKLPAGWLRFEGGIYANRIMATVDGPDLQRIEAFRVNHDKAFEKIKKVSKTDMLPSELAELAIAELKSYNDMLHVEVISNQPADIGGSSGFRLHLRARNERGLRIDRLIYGFADAKGFYAIYYEAPKLHYFDKDLANFEATVKSFRKL